MRIWSGCCSVVLLLTSLIFAEWTSANGQSTQGAQVRRQVQDLLESNVHAEWEAFKNKDKKTYSDLLADDFVAIEDDGQGTGKKSAAVSEVDRSVVSRYYLFALNILPLDPDAALVTYELTMEFPPKAQVRLKRVLVSELWLKRDGQWKMRYYQETRVR